VLIARRFYKAFSCLSRVVPHAHRCRYFEEEAIVSYTSTAEMDGRPRMSPPSIASTTGSSPERACGRSSCVRDDEPSTRCETTVCDELLKADELW